MKDIEQNKNFGWNELQHSINNELAVIGSFLVLCHAMESDKTFSECLQNAEKSLMRVKNMVGEVG